VLLRCEVSNRLSLILPSAGSIEIERSIQRLYRRRYVTSDWPSNCQEIVRRSDSSGTGNLRRLYMVREITRLSATICECVG
jgi:hypothetical protein